MTVYIIRMEYQAAVAEIGVYVHLTDNTVSFINNPQRATQFPSPQKAKEAFIRKADLMLQHANPLSSLHREFLLPKLPEWLRHFIDDSGQLQMEDLMGQLYVEEVPVPITNTNMMLRYLIKTPKGWVGSSDNLMSCGFELMDRQCSAHAFWSLEGALAACQSMDLDERTIFTTATKIVAFDALGMKDDAELNAVAASLERLHLIRALAPATQKLPEVQKRSSL